MWVDVGPPLLPRFPGGGDAAQIVRTLPFPAKARFLSLAVTVLLLHRVLNSSFFRDPFPRRPV